MYINKNIKILKSYLQAAQTSHATQQNKWVYTSCRANKKKQNRLGLEFRKFEKIEKKKQEK